MNHPVKRYKPNEDTKIKQEQRHRSDIYAGHMHTQCQPSQIPPPILEYQIKSEPMTGAELDGQSIMQLNDIKKEPVDGDDSNKLHTESLYTSEGLQPSYKDLDQIFDEENSGSSPIGVSFFLTFYFKSNLQYKKDQRSCYQF